MAAGPAANAAVLLKPRTLEVRDFPLPAIGPDEALLKLERAESAAPTTSSTRATSPRTSASCRSPAMPGHEPLGVIAEIGARARERWRVEVGDRMAVRSGYETSPRFARSGRSS